MVGQVCPNNQSDLRGIAHLNGVPAPKTSLRLVRRCVACLLILVVGFDPRALATIVHPELTRCPLCDQTFVITQLVSYSRFGEIPRDLYRTPVVPDRDPIVCPHCLYASFGWDRLELTPQTRSLLREFLKNPKLDLSAEERAAIGGAAPDSRLRSRWFSGLLLARECYRIRFAHRDDPHDFPLKMYYATRESPDRDADLLHRHYRKLAIAFLARQTEEVQITEHRRAVFTYLRGELLRRDGNLEAASRFLGLAKQIAERYSQDELEGRQDSLLWLAEFADEQLLRIEAVGVPTNALAPWLHPYVDDVTMAQVLRRKVALQMLVARDDRAAWEVIADFALASRENLLGIDHTLNVDLLRYRANPRLWSAVQRDFAQWLPGPLPPTDDELRAQASELTLFLNGNAGQSATTVVDPKPGETLKELAKRTGNAVSRIRELNSGLANTDDDDAWATPIKVVRLPRDWKEYRLIESVAAKVEAGDASAIGYWWRWCDTLSESSIHRFHYEIQRCLAALGRLPDDRVGLPDPRAPVGTETRLLSDCLRYRRGERPLRDSLLAKLDSDHLERAELILSTLQAGRDSSALDRVLETMRRNPKYCPEEYIRAFASTDHDAALEQIARFRDGFNRKGIEDIRAAIKLRQLLQP